MSDHHQKRTTGPNRPHTGTSEPTKATERTTHPEQPSRNDNHRPQEGIADTFSSTHANRKQQQEPPKRAQAHKHAMPTITERERGVYGKNDLAAPPSKDMPKLKHQLKTETKVPKPEQLHIPPVLMPYIKNEKKENTK